VIVETDEQEPVIVVGIARRDDDESPPALACLLAGLTASSLLLVHAYRCQPLISVPPPGWEEALAAEPTAGLLVCGSRGYGPAHALLSDSVSASLARAAACPLLVVRRADDAGRDEA
jgi:hypothetical protein